MRIVGVYEVIPKVTLTAYWYAGMEPIDVIEMLVKLADENGMVVRHPLKALESEFDQWKKNVAEQDFRGRL